MGMADAWRTPGQPRGDMGMAAQRPEQTFGTDCPRHTWRCLEEDRVRPISPWDKPGRLRGCLQETQPWLLRMPRKEQAGTREKTRTEKSGTAVETFTADQAAGGHLARVGRAVRVPRPEAGSVWMTWGVLTFQGAGEDTDRAERPLPLSRPLEAVRTQGLGGQHLRPACLLRRRGLEARRNVSVPGRALPGLRQLLDSDRSWGGHRETGWGSR